jgi:hypothetical protein
MTLTCSLHPFEAAWVEALRGYMAAPLVERHARDDRPMTQAERARVYRERKAGRQPPVTAVTPMTSAERARAYRQRKAGRPA